MAGGSFNFHRALLSRLLWPTGILFASTLWLVFSTMLWTTDRANEVAIQHQRARFSASLDRLVERVRLEIGQTLGSTGLEVLMRQPGGPSAGAFELLSNRFRQLDAVLLVAPPFAVRVGVADHARLTADRVPKIRALLEDSVAEAVRSVRLRGEREAGAELKARLLAADDDLYVALALNLQADEVAEDASPLVLALLRKLTPTEIADLAALNGLTGFAVSRDAPDEGLVSVQIAGPPGEPALYLAWQPERPGEAIREDLVPASVIGFCLAALLFGAVAFYLHRVTRDLVRSQTRSQELVGRDPLSGLANRLAFGERLDGDLVEMGTSGRGLAVLFIDLDRFKDVNDTYGHQAGDELIRLVAQRLGSILRPEDTLARFGGDEFAIIQVGIPNVRAAESLARRILDTLTHPFEIAHTQVTVGASIGIALAPENAIDRETLMRLADTALYQAKSEGRNRFSLFQSRMDETIRMRKMVEDDLRDAIQNDGLLLQYQPVYSADGERIVAAEALVRWPHPTKGLISPGQFIAIAEERGLIIPLGEWVLRRACEDGKRWPGLRIAVNVSAIQFRHRSFVESVTRVLESTNFDPGRLELELTEGVVVDDADAAEAAMVDLRALGIHLALDDFGTGYSSLIYLRRFAFDKIKIDRSFLESMEATGESAILVHSIVHLGRALGLTVTAEGVETREQQRFLQALGCHQLQGYLFSKPISAADLDRLIARQNAADASVTNVA
ncbi:MAG: EAL domain-containing protein [Methylobacteriaceae bacterium]|nr:EAL domain-containing protein [Methylobacteriaceae bacterium]